MSNSTGVGADALWLALVVADDAPIDPALELRQRLTDRKVEICDPSHPDCALVVVVVPEGPSLDREIHDHVSGAAQLVPVVFGSRRSDEFKDLSQIIRPAGDTDEVAQRIIRLSELDGGDLTLVNDLTAAARRWADRERSPHELPNASATVEALPVVARATRAGAAGSQLLVEYVRAAARYHRNRQRHRFILLASISGILAMAMVAALIMKVAADTAASRSLQMADVAVSDRLTGLVADSLRSQPDPDLAWLLAGQAMSAELSPEAVRTARLVRARIPAHRSIHLERTPRDLTTSSAGLMAITNDDGSVDIRDGSGATIRSWGPAGVEVVTALADSGREIALVKGSELILNRDGAQGFPASQDENVRTSGEIVGAGWQGESLVLAKRDGLFLLRDGKLRRAALQPPGSIKDIRGIDITPDGTRLVVWGSGGFWIAEHDGKFVYRGRDRTTIVKVVLSKDGESGYVLNRRGGIGLVLIAKDEDPSYDGVVGSGFNIFRAGDLVMQAHKADELCPVSPPAGASTYCLRAHPGSVIGAGDLGRGKVASVGSDMYLRIWETLGVGIYGSPLANASGRWRVPENDANQIQRRSRLVCRDADDLCWAVLPEIGVMTLLDKDLKGIGTSWVGSLGILHNSLTAEGDFLGLHSTTGVTVYALSSDGARKTAWRFDGQGQWVGTVDALGPGGRQYVAASASGVTIWSDGAIERFEHSGSLPTGIVFPASGGGPTVYFADGSTLSAGESASPMPKVPNRAVVGIGGSEGDQLWWVTADNKLQTTTHGEVRTVSALSPDLGIYALQPSADSHFVAVFAAREALVVRVSDGQIMFASGAASEQATVQDVVFREDEILTIDHSGAVRRERLRSSLEYEKEFLAALPRHLTDEEEALFHIQDRGR